VVKAPSLYGSLRGEYFFQALVPFLNYKVETNTPVEVVVAEGVSEPNGQFNPYTELIASKSNKGWELSDVNIILMFLTH